VLVPVGNLEPASSNTASNPPKPYLMQAIGTAGIDGSFRLDGIPPGDYLIGALSAGLLSVDAPQSFLAPEQEFRRALSSVPVVHIAAGQSSTISLHLHPGAVVSGKVRYADGRPVVAATVAWEAAANDLALRSVRLAQFSPTEQVVRAFNYYDTRKSDFTTDDQGRYRIYGLAPGNYIVSTFFQSKVCSAAQLILSDGSSRTPNNDPGIPELNVVYAPGVFRRQSARVIRVRGSENVLDADIVVDASGLLTVRGRIVAGGDRHPPAHAILVLEEEGSHENPRYTSAQSDGSFQFNYTPPGKYVLELMGARDDAPLRAGSSVLAHAREYRMPDRNVILDRHNLDLGDVVLTDVEPGEPPGPPR
jgi:hypothetical protein